MIRFLEKIAVQHVLSAMPSDKLYNRILDRVGSRRPTQGMVQQKVDVGLGYLDALDGVGASLSPGDGPIVDVGAGWHFTIPLLYWQLGATCQHLTDIHRRACEETVFGTARYLQTAEVSRPRRDLPDPAGFALNDYLEALGIRYHAPCMGLGPIDSGSAQLVMATQVLLHPPRSVLREIMREVARVLRPGGYFVATIHLYDLYSNFDTHLPPHNFLRYSEQTWERWFNTRHISYNRLRASDYEALLLEFPFVNVLWNVEQGTQDDLAALDRLPPWAGYARYDRNDLGAKHLFFIMRRA